MKFADSPGEGVFRLLGIRVRIFRPIIVLIAFCSAHGIATTAICGELSKRPTILLRAANHANLRSASSDEADVISTVSQGTLLAELPMAVSLPAGSRLQTQVLQVLRSQVLRNRPKGNERWMTCQF